MNYRLISISSNQYWKQDADAKTHTLTFRPDSDENPVSGMAGAMMGGASLVQQFTEKEASTYTLGGLYAVNVGPAEAAVGQ